MITLDASIVYLTKYYELNTKRTNVNAYKNIDEMTDAQAAQSTANTENAKVEIHSVSELIEALKLEEPSNRFYILSKLQQNDLAYLLQFMEKDDLAIGLKFFNKDKLLDMIGTLPKQDLVNMLFRMVNERELFEMLPERALTGLLGSEKIDKTMLMDLLKMIPGNILSKIYEGATGLSSANKNKWELLVLIEPLKKEQLADGISSLSSKELQSFVRTLTHDNPQLYTEFSTSQLMHPMEQMTKLDLIEGSKALKPEQLVNMLDELPQEFLSQLTLLLDPTKLAEILEKYYGNFLSQLGS